MYGRDRDADRTVATKLLIAMGRSARCAACGPLLLCIIAAWSALGQAVDVSKLPHVDECSICKTCHLTGTLPDRPVALDELVGGNFQPDDVSTKQDKPACEECHGCTTNLTTLVKSGFKDIFGRKFVDEGGASPNWLFLAPTSRTHSGRAIVKVSCIPVAKLHDRKAGEPGHTAAKPRCFADHSANFARLLLAIEQVAEDCGLDDIVPKVWVEEVNGVIPGVGYHIRWLALWMEQAEGISLENLVRLGDPMMHPNEFLEIMHDRLNKTRIVHAAMFDLLTSQCDRHAQNIFIAEDGGIMLIDNERAFYENKWCAIDSILLPTTKKFTINVMENSWVHKFKDWGDKEPKCWANVPLLLDYRCYVDGGELGTNYPPKLNRCLRKIRSLGVEDLQLEYGLPDMTATLALRNRSVDMLEHGFEHALTLGYPRNPNPWRYRFAPPCCKIKHTDTYRCAHDWQPDVGVPWGDPVSGGEWKRDWPDHGSYEGGSSFGPTSGWVASGGGGGKSQ